MLIEFIKDIQNYFSVLKKRRFLRKKYPTCKFEYPNTIVNIQELKLGKHIQIGSGSYLHCGGYEWSNFKGKIEIGDNSIIGQNAIMYGAGEIKIGKNVDIGPGSKIFSSRTNYELESSIIPQKKHIFKNVQIGDSVIIFANVTISPGVIIGEGAIIGAGSVVLDDIPSWTISYGVPAKVNRKRNISSE